VGPAPQPEPGAYTGPDAALPGEERGSNDTPTGDVLAELADLRRRVQQNDDEIDAMQIAAAQAQGRGALLLLRQPAVLIAFFSLALAFGTTLLSTVRLDQDQRHAARTELTGHIQRLTDIPRQEAEVLQQHPGADGSNLVAELNAEMQSVAYQARNVIRSIPNDVATVEYMAVGYAFQSLGAVTDARDLYQLGLAHAATSEDRIFALRSLGGISFLLRDFDAGRQFMQQARDAHSNDPTAPQLVVASDNAQTELFWAGAELTAGNCPEAAAHADAAQQIMSTQPLSNLGPNLEQLRAGIIGCIPSATPQPAASPV
jgi:hypothetical protein